MKLRRYIPAFIDHESEELTYHEPKTLEELLAIDWVNNKYNITGKHKLRISINSDEVCLMRVYSSNNRYVLGYILDNDFLGLPVEDFRIK